MKYHIWTEGCQMNTADSQRVASALEGLCNTAVPRIEDAEVIMLNSWLCARALKTSHICSYNLGVLRPMQ